MFTAGGIIYDAQGNPIGPDPNASVAEQAAVGGGRTLGGQVRNLRRKTQVATERGAQAAQDFLKRYPQAGGYARLGTAALAATPALRTSLGELEEGRPLGAAAALAPAGLSALGAGMIGRTGQAMIGKGGFPGTALGLGLMGLGAILPGAAASGAEKAKRKATGEPIAGEEDFANQLARARQIDELGTTRFRNNMGVITSGAIDLQKAISDQAHLDLQRKFPIINQLNNAALVRQQALLNTQNQGYLQQGMLATAGALAQGAQAETGATVRTALTSNPYANATMQAPQIRFG